MSYLTREIDNKESKGRRAAHWRLRHESRLRGQLFRRPHLTFGGLTKFLGARRSTAALRRIERVLPIAQQEALAA